MARRMFPVPLPKAEMRKRLARGRDATFTYSMEYLSQMFTLVDEVRLKKQQEVRTSVRACVILIIERDAPREIR